MNFRLSHFRTTNVGACPKEKQNNVLMIFFEKQVHLLHLKYELSRINMRLIIVNRSQSYAFPHFIKKYPDFLYLMYTNFCMHFSFIVAEDSKISTRVDCGRGLGQVTIWIMV